MLLMNQLLMNVDTLTPIELGFGMRLSSPLGEYGISYIMDIRMEYTIFFSLLLWYVIVSS